MEYDPDRNWRLIDDAGFNTHIGPLWYSKIDDHSSQVALKIEPQHLNMGGVCHGGVYMSACDTAMGLTAYRVMGRVPCATIDFHSHFLSAAKQNQWLVIVAHVNRATGDVVFMECEAWAGGRKCFVASGIWKRLNVPSNTAR